MKTKNAIYGKHPVLEALRAGQSMEKLLMLRNATAPEIKEIKSLASKQGVPIQMVPIQKLNAITGKNHQGVLAFTSLIQYFKLDDVLMKAYDEGRSPLFLLLDGITDVRNFGAITRTALCMGVDAIVVPKRGGALINADAMKASAGALQRVHVCKVDSMQQAVDFCKTNGILVFASQMNAKKSLFELDLTIPCAVIMGAEDIGVSPAVLSKADETFKIPMTGKIDSLNVSVSAGMIVYEAFKQRMLAD